MTGADRFIAGLVGVVASAVVWSIAKTLRVRYVGLENVRRARRMSANGAVLHAFWHSRLMTLAETHMGRGAVVMVSSHRDGEYIARAIRPLGFPAVRGSSSRGGIRAALELAVRGRGGSDVGITVDGPRGPREQAKVGVAIVASRSGLAIVPCAASARWRWTARSWDGFQVALPFTRCVVVYGDPLRVEPRAREHELEAARAMVEARVAAAARLADELAA